LKAVIHAALVLTSERKKEGRKERRVGEWKKGRK